MCNLSLGTFVETNYHRIMNIAREIFCVACFQHVVLTWWHVFHLAPGDTDNHSDWSGSASGPEAVGTSCQPEICSLFVLLG